MWHTNTITMDHSGNMKAAIKRTLTKEGFSIKSIKDNGDGTYLAKTDKGEISCEVTDDGLTYSCGPLEGTLQLAPDPAVDSRVEKELEAVVLDTDEEQDQDRKSPVEEDSYAGLKLNPGFIRYGNCDDLEKPGPVIRIKEKKDRDGAAAPPPAKPAVATSVPNGGSKFCETHQDEVIGNLIKSLKLASKDFESCIIVVKPDVGAASIRRFPFKNKLASLNNGILKMQVQRIRDLMEDGEVILNKNLSR